MEGKGDDFSQFMDDVAVKGALAGGIGLGVSLNIFDVMASIGPKTFQEIAEAGKWKPRYVKEWLNLMTTGNIIEYIAEEKQYYISEDKKKYLTSAGGTQNKSIFLQGFSICGLVSDQMKDCFALDGPKGTTYSSYKGFHEWRNDRTMARFDWEGPAGLKNIFLSAPDIFLKLENGIHVCDGGTSTGVQVMILADKFSNSTFRAFDISEHSIQLAKKACQEKQLKNLTFETQDACNMPSYWTDSFDLYMVFDVVHDVPDSRKMLKEVLRVLKPGGAFLMMDINMHADVADNIGNKFAPVIYFLSLFHCMPVSLNEGGQGLGAAWGIETQKVYLEEAGFRNVQQLVTKDTHHSFYLGYK